MSKERELLKASEVQEILGVSKAYIYKLLKSKEIPSFRIGTRGAIRIRGVDLDHFIANRMADRSGLVRITFESVIADDIAKEAY